MDTSVQRRVERGQLQAGRPRRGQPTQPLPTSRGDQERPRKGGADLAEILGRPIKGRPAGLTLSCHVLISGVEAKQPTHLRNVHVLASAPPWKSYKRTPTPALQHTPKVLFSLILSFYSRLGSLGVRVESSLSRDSRVVIGSQV